MADYMLQRRADPIVLRPSSAIIHSTTLDPIPQSAVPTPAQRESPDPPLDESLPEGGPSSLGLARALDEISDSRRSSVSNVIMPGSYFLARPTGSGLQSPGGDRIRPAIEIPASTPEEPVFSSYPPSRSNSIGKGKGLGIPLKPFSLSAPPPSKSSGKESSSGTDISPSVAVLNVGRRRSSSLSTSSTSSPVTIQAEPSSAILKPSKSIFRRRRASVGTPAGVAPEYQLGQVGPTWNTMAEQEAQRLVPPPEVPFTYQQPTDSGYTLQSVSTITTVRPLASPNITPRRSSLGGSESTSFFVQANETTLVIPDDMTIPHEPPPRRSSLDMSNMVKDDLPVVAADARSFLSSSITNTEISAFSASHEHPLSSATTSLSRSAKSGKEGQDERDAALSAIRLQRSLEWEAKQTIRRTRLEKRKMILLELVELEVAYVEDLRTLIQIHFPQLAALPSISERTTALIARNTSDLLDFHAQFATQMVDVLKQEALRYEPQHDVDNQIERASRRIASLFVNNVAMFAGYRDYCAGSVAAGTLVRHVTARPDFEAFEKRCQIITAAQSYLTLQDLLDDNPPSSSPTNRSRQEFSEYLMKPIQQICRYQLLFTRLAETSPPANTELADSDDEDVMNVGTDVETALIVMKLMAKEADEARLLREAEIKSATILERMEPHHVLSPSFIKSLGTCRLIGSLDVLHHHPVVAPLIPPAKVKYLAAFLYRGYLILAKVKKGKVYEAKHFLPLEVFELIDITEGFLPHSIRLTLRDHNFDLAAACEQEKQVWSAALCEARDESVVPPFELPASVSPFAARTRRMSTLASPELSESTPGPSLHTPNKRHTMAVTPPQLNMAAVARSTTTASPTPMSSPIRTTFSSAPTSSRPTTVLLRRPSASARLHVDRGLHDVFSYSCSQARSNAQSHHALFLTENSTTFVDRRSKASMREPSMLRRRKSFLDSRNSSSNVAVSGEIRGALIPIRSTRSTTGRNRAVITRPRANSAGHHRAINSTPGTGHVSASETADETVTYSDFARNLTGYNSVASTSPATSPGPGHSLESRTSYPFEADIGSDTAASDANFDSVVPRRPVARRQSRSVANFHDEPETYSVNGQRERTRSTPASPTRTSSTLPSHRYSQHRTSSTYKRSATDGSHSIQRSSNPTNTLRPISYFPLNTSVASNLDDSSASSSPNLGNNSSGKIMEQSRKQPQRQKSWSTLRRSMSFLKSSSSLTTDLGISNMTPTESYLALDENTPPPLPSKDTTDQKLSAALSGLGILNPSLTGLIGNGSESIESRLDKQLPAVPLSETKDRISTDPIEWGSSYSHIHIRSQSSPSKTDRPEISPLPRGGSLDYTSNSSSAVGLSGLTLTSTDEGEDETSSGSGHSGEGNPGNVSTGSSVPNTPKRKKSILFRSIGRFTPM